MSGMNFSNSQLYESIINEDLISCRDNFGDVFVVNIDHSWFFMVLLIYAELYIVTFFDLDCFLHMEERNE